MNVINRGSRLALLSSALVLALAACGENGPAEKTLGRPTAGSELTIAQLAFTVQPANSIAGQKLANISVAVEDSSGAIVTSATSPVTVSLSGPSAPATLAGTVTICNSRPTPFREIRSRPRSRWRSAMRREMSSPRMRR